MAAVGERSAPSRLLLIASAFTIVLGVWGFVRYQPSEPLSDSVYRTFQLFVLETGDASGTLPWQLEIARYAAAAITATSIVLAAIALSRDRLDRWRARRARGHVIVCGLGRRGLPAALALRQAGHAVVAVEIDRGSDAVDRCRRSRIPVIVGDARDPDVLGRAGVARAAHLVVLVSGIDVGCGMALAAIDAAAERRDGTLGIHVEMDDPRLAALFRAANLSTHPDVGWRLDEFDLPQAGGAVMVDELAAWPAGATTAQVLVVGRTALGTAVVRELVRRWRHHASPDGGLTVTVLDPDGDLRRPPPPSTDRVDVHTTTHLDRGALERLIAAYVCLDDEAESLVAALDLVGRRPDLPTLVHVERAASLAALLARPAPSLHWVSVDEHILTPAALLNSTEERIARSLHECYRRTVASPDDASAASWDQLPEHLRASNRAQAAHVATKVRAVGCVIVPDDGTPTARFTDAEVEVLGALEHERWTEERLTAGWSRGPRDQIRRTSPDLIPWDELTDEVRDIDRRFVAAIPDVLADAGLRLSRLGSGPGGEQGPSAPPIGFGRERGIRHWAPAIIGGSMKSEPTGLSRPRRGECHEP